MRPPTQEANPPAVSRPTRSAEAAEETIGRIGGSVAKKRVHEIAKAQGVTSKELIAALGSAGVEVKAAASSVDEEVALEALRSADGASASKPKAKTPTKPKAKQPTKAKGKSNRAEKGQAPAEKRAPASKPKAEKTTKPAVAEPAAQKPAASAAAAASACAGS